jgi:VanZ family protein
MSITRIIRICSVVAMVLIVFAALGPGKLAPRTGLGWQMDHFLGYLGLTLMVCLAWPRALVVGGVLTVFAVLLEGLQGFTPDRMPDIHAALYSAAGVLSAALPADVFMRAPRRLDDWRRLISQHVSRLRQAPGRLVAAVRPRRAPSYARAWAMRPVRRRSEPVF